MKDIKLLISAAGYFGCNTLVENLKNNGERKIEIIGTDMNPNCAARFYCDKFYPTPAGHEPDFIPKLLDICKQEKPDILLPASSYEVYPLAFHRKEFEGLGIKLMISNTSTLDVALDKFDVYHRLTGIIPLPNYFYSRKGFVSKPVNGKGARDIKIYQDESLIMEKMEGEEIDADVLSYDKDVLLAVFKTRERVYGGTLVEGKIVSRPYLLEQIKRIIKVIPIQYLSVIQFMGGKLLEINPRLAGCLPYFKEWNMPYLAVKLALGEITPEEIKKYQDKIQFNMKIVRFLDQKQYSDD